MKTKLTAKDFDFHLPTDLIAKYPLDNREDSRMMVLGLEDNTVTHKHFTDFVDYLNSGDLLVLNDTRVISARLLGKKKTGGKVEVLLIKELGVRQGGSSSWQAMLRGGKSVKVGDSFDFASNDKKLFGGNGKKLTVTLKEKQDDGFVTVELKTNDDLIETINAVGVMPLPPYIDREAEEVDKTRYQTVFSNSADSSKAKAVAAPTAGLHFTEAVIDKIKAKGVKVAYITLHTGPGTFLPIRVENIEDHKVPTEEYSITEAVYDDIVKTKKNGGRVVAVGTTVTRTLEAALGKDDKGNLTKDKLTGETDIFISQGYKFKVVDALLTNFHLPESSLIMLVSALVGVSFTMDAYREAVKEKYRFFSYGDCMFVQ